MGDEEDGHEEVRRRQGQAREVLRLPWNQAEDFRWTEEVRPQEKQGRKGGVRQALRRYQEEQGLLQDHGLGLRCQGRPPCYGNQGLLRCWWKDCQGKGPARQGQVPLQEVN